VEYEHSRTLTPNKCASGRGILLFGSCIINVAIGGKCGARKMKMNTAAILDTRGKQISNLILVINQSRRSGQV